MNPIINETVEDIDEDQAESGPEPSLYSPWVVVGRVLGFLVLASIIGIAQFLLRGLPIFSVLFISWVGLMIATLTVLLWLKVLSARTLVLFGIGWASAVILVHAEMLKEIRDASGQENDWESWYWTGIALVGGLVLIWGVPHLWAKYHKRT